MLYASPDLDLEDMARTDPAFARLVDLGFARAARQDAEWWVDASRQLDRANVRR